MYRLIGKFRDDLSPIVTYQNIIVVGFRLNPQLKYFLRHMHILWSTLDVTHLSRCGQCEN